MRRKLILILVLLCLVVAAKVFGSEVKKAMPPDTATPPIPPTMTPSPCPVFYNKTDFVNYIVKAPSGSCACYKGDDLKLYDFSNKSIHEFFFGNTNIDKKGINKTRELTIDKKMLIEEVPIEIPDNNTNKTQLSTSDVGILWQNFVGEWARYVRDSDYTIVRMSGIIQPENLYNTGEEFCSYQEREFYLDYGTEDLVEYIVRHYDDGTIRIWVAVYDNGFEGPDKWYFGFESGDVSHEYIFEINSGYYYFWLKNIETGDVEVGFYDDTDDPSDYINWLKGSAELYYNVLDKEFKAETWINDYWAWDENGNYYRPRTVFDWAGYSEEKPYVEMTAYSMHDNTILTRHECYYFD